MVHRTPGRFRRSPPDSTNSLFRVVCAEVDLKQDQSDPPFPKNQFKRKLSLTLAPFTRQAGKFFVALGETLIVSQSSKKRKKEVKLKLLWRHAAEYFDSTILHFTQSLFSRLCNCFNSEAVELLVSIFTMVMKQLSNAILRDSPIAIHQAEKKQNNRLEECQCAVLRDFLLQAQRDIPRGTHRALNRARRSLALRGFTEAQLQCRCKCRPHQDRLKSVLQKP